MRKPAYSNTFFKIFLPATVVVAFSIGIMTLLFSHVFEKNSVSVFTSEYRKNLAMIRNMYTEIQFAVLPSALNMQDDMRIRNFLFAHGFQYDVALSGLAEIDKIHTLNKYIHSIYLYNQDFGYLSTFKGYRDIDNSTDPSLDKLFEVADFRLNSMLPRRVLFEGASEAENLFSYINGGKDEATGKIKYAFVFNLSESKIRKMLVSDSPETESEFYIINSDGMYLSHPDPELFSTSARNNHAISLVLRNTQNAGHEFVRGANNEKWLAVWSDQTELGWRFLYLIPEKKIFARLTSLRNTLFVISAAVLLASLSLVLVMSRRIQASLEYEKKLADYIRGTSEFGEKFLSAKNWYVGLLRCDFLNGSEKLENHSVLLRRYKWLTAEFAACSNKTLCVPVDDTTYCTLSPSLSLWYDEDFYLLRKKMVTEFSSEITGAYAAQSCGFDEIPAFYELLRKELQQTCMISLGLSRKIGYTPGAAAARKIPAEFDFSVLAQAFKTTDTTKAAAEITRLEVYLTDKKDYFLFKTSATQAGFLAAQIFGDKLDPYLSGGMDGWRSALFQCEQISALVVLLQTLLQALNIFCELQIGSNNAKMTRYMKNYIISNIHDKNLNSALVSQSLGISLNYAREIFKKTEKLSINEYIGLYRVELAKQYLAGTDKTVQELCDIAGFSNYSYFCTYFKKIEGVSPSEFRMDKRISK